MDTRKRVRGTAFLAIGLLVGLAALASSCGSQGAASALKPGGPEATAAAAEASQARERRIALADEAVRNGKYELPDIGTFQLKDGTYQEKYGDGATQVKRVGVVSVAFGDLDGDRVEDAAVVLWANTGGSGTFIYLAPVLNKDGKGQQAGSELLGDRVQVKSLSVNSGRIDLELLAQGSADPMVSPSLQSTREYAIQGGKLVRLAPVGATSQPATATAQQSLARPASGAPSGLVGTIWIWQRFVDSGEKGSFAVPYPPAYRLEMLPSGTYSLRADCNLGSGSYSVEGSRLALKPDPMTMAECQRGSRSSQFVDMMGQVATYVLEGGTLHLNLRADGGDLIFSKLSSVTGRLVLPPATALPEDATVEAMIANAAGAQMGGSIVKAQPSLEFEAPFKPEDIDPSAGYTLNVTVKDAQKGVIFRSSRPYPVLTQGNPTYHIEVQLERVR